MASRGRRRVNVRFWVPVATSQTVTRAGSAPVVASRVPSGLKAATRPPPRTSSRRGGARGPASVTVRSPKKATRARTSIAPPSARRTTGRAEVSAATSSLVTVPSLWR